MSIMSPKFLPDIKIKNKYDIKFVIGREHWPEELKSLLSGVDKISTIQYDEWKRAESSSERTWKRNRREAADKLVKKAKLLRQYTTKKYEKAWRTLESRMFKTLLYNPFW